MEREMIKRIIILEKEIKQLKQQIEVLQDFTGLKDTIRKNLDKFYTERLEEDNIRCS